MRAELGAFLRQVDIPLPMTTHDPDDLAWFGDEAFQLRDGAIDLAFRSAGAAARTSHAPQRGLTCPSCTQGRPEWPGVD